jgi:hypothetical protein
MYISQWECCLSIFEGVLALRLQNSSKTLLEISMKIETNFFNAMDFCPI